MKILFLCTHNACRSVLGEVITRALAGNRIVAASAGSEPSGKIHPLTLANLEAHGYPVEGLRSKGLDEIEAFAPDVVITVCDSAARESCPVWLGGAVKIHWGLPDPSHITGSEQDKARAFAAVIRTIESRIRALLEQAFETMNREQLTTQLQAIGESY